MLEPAYLEKSAPLGSTAMKAPKFFDNFIISWDIFFVITPLAAENEQDPELREKLWEEYRKYKEQKATTARAAPPSDINQKEKE